MMRGGVTLFHDTGSVARRYVDADLVRAVHACRADSTCVPEYVELD